MCPIWILLKAERIHVTETMSSIFCPPPSRNPFPCLSLSPVIHFTATGNPDLVQCSPEQMKINSLQYQGSALGWGGVGDTLNFQAKAGMSLGHWLLPCWAGESHLVLGTSLGSLLPEAFRIPAVICFTVQLAVYSHSSLPLSWALLVP